MKENGAQVDEIKKTLNTKLNGKIENYVNKSNVGAIMIMDDSGL